MAQSVYNYLYNQNMAETDKAIAASQAVNKPYPETLANLSSTSEALVSMTLANNMSMLITMVGKINDKLNSSIETINSKMESIIGRLEKLESDMIQTKKLDFLA